jgi:hypothetical protein
VSLSAHAIITWLRRHATAAGGIRALHIDLSHHAGAHDFEGASLASLVQQLPQLARVHMAGAVEGTDAYEPLGEAGSVLLVAAVLWCPCACNADC